MKVKVFTNEGDAPELERTINKWFSENPNIKVRFIKQGYCESSEVEHLMNAMISIWYED